MKTDWLSIARPIAALTGRELESVLQRIADAMAEAERGASGASYIDARVDAAEGLVEVFRFRTVVEHVTDPSAQVSLEQADAIAGAPGEFEIGDDLGEQVEHPHAGLRALAELGRAAAFEPTDDLEQLWLRLLWAIPGPDWHRVEHLRIVQDAQEQRWGPRPAFEPWTAQRPDFSQGLVDVVRAGLPAVHTIELHVADLDPAVVPALFEASLPSLRSLSLTWPSDGPGLDALARASWASSMTSLHLRGAPLDVAGFDALCSLPVMQIRGAVSLLHSRRRGDRRALFERLWGSPDATEDEQTRRHQQLRHSLPGLTSKSWGHLGDDWRDITG